MKVKIEKINKQKAIELLNNNTENRQVYHNLVPFLVNQMTKGLWKQNGESIIIDKNGKIKDGQHRLMAIVDADFSDFFVIAYDVDPNVFDTIDTGKSRGLKDILKINGYKNEGHLAGTISSIFSVENENPMFSQNTRSGSLKVDNKRAFGHRHDKIVRGNNERFAFFKKHEQYVNSIRSESESLYGKQNIKLMGPTVISSMVHRLRAFKTGKCNQITEFMEEVIGYNSENGSAPNFLYKRLLEQKTKKEVKYSSRYINIIFAKAWNDYQIGAKIRMYQIKNNSEAPPINRSLLIFE